jgi:hypothetical protein
MVFRFFKFSVSANHQIKSVPDGITEFFMKLNEQYLLTKSLNDLPGLSGIRDMLGAVVQKYPVRQF